MHLKLQGLERKTNGGINEPLENTGPLNLSAPNMVEGLSLCILIRAEGNTAAVKKEKKNRFCKKWRG